MTEERTRVRAPRVSIRGKTVFRRFPGSDVVEEIGHFRRSDGGYGTKKKPIRPGRIDHAPVPAQEEAE